MATNFTSALGLQKPSTSDRNWDMPLNANSDLLDGLSALRGLVVTPNEFPSASLQVRVAPGRFRKSDGTFVDFPGATAVALSALSSTKVWLTDLGQLTTGAAYPATLYVPLAQVVTSANAVASVADGRVQCFSAGVVLPTYLSTAGGTVQGTFTVHSDASGKTVVQADPVANALAFFGATPAAQSPTSADLIDQTAGVAGGTMVDVGASHSQAVLNANFASLTAKVNTLLDTLKRFGLISTS